MKFSLIVAAVAGLSFFGITEDASAIDRFAGVTINNSLGLRINYQVKWGDGSWQQRSIGPNGSRSEWFRYKRPGQNRSPRLQIRFDSDMSGETHNVVYDLKKYASPDRDSKSFKQYIFRTDGTQGRYIDLKRKK